MKFNLFGKARKETKLKFLSDMEITELLSIPEESFQRILRETGEGKPKRRERRLPLLERTGNSWNSDVLEIRRTSGAKIYFMVYHQLSHTDTIISAPFSEFMDPRSEWRGVSYEFDRWGGKTPRYCVYTPHQKAEVIREILRTFLEKKYPPKVS